jgi:hypothetical protein
MVMLNAHLDGRAANPPPPPEGHDPNPLDGRSTAADFDAEVPLDERKGGAVVHALNQV